MSRTNPVYREKLDHYASRFEAFAAEQNGDPAWLVDLRARSMARFQELQQHIAQEEEQTKGFISRWRKGVAEEAKGDYAAAVDDLMGALRLRPENLYTHILLYRAYRELGREQRAEDMFRGINDLLKTRSLGDVCTDLGVELIRRGEGEMAAEVLEEATAWDPALPRTRYYLVALYSRLGRPERGRPHLEALAQTTQSRQ